MGGYQAPEDWPGRSWPVSRSCLAGAHDGCGHLGSFALGLWDGGRVALVLCQCGCHSVCLLAGRPALVSRVIWVGLCTCRGTELAEDRLDEAQREVPDIPDMEHMLRECREEQARHRQERRAAARAARAAWEATRGAADGNSRAQIREIYVAELRRRGLAVPSDLVLDATADAIARNRAKFSVVYSARVLAELGRDFGKLFSRFGTEA
jgi:hypothetical protein